MNPATNPMIAIPRSRFMQDFTHTTSWLHGDVIPVDCFEVVAGDDFTVKKAAAEIIMSTPIAPIFGNIKAKVCAFFVPMRLLWEHTEEFFGANKTSAGPQLSVYKIPRRSIYRDAIYSRSVSHYLGKPICDADNTKLNFGLASVLKERGYWFIISEWYRQQQLQDPFIMSKGDTGYIGSVGSDSKAFSSLPAKCCKQWDMFTAATLAPQYGAAVSLPLGSYAPVVLRNDDTSASYGPDSVPMFSGSGTGGVIPAGTISTGTHAASAGSGTDYGAATLLADLSQATAAKINDIRYAFQLQKYLERANFGTRSRL